MFGALSGGVRSGNVSITQVAGSKIGATYFLCGSDNNYVASKSTRNIDYETIVIVANSNNSQYEAYSKRYNSQYPEIQWTAGAAITTAAMPYANIHMLNCNGVSVSETKRFVGKVWSFKMSTEGGTVIRNFVPVKRVSDSVVGMYDTVGGGFYVSADANGTFTAGPDVN